MRRGSEPDWPEESGGRVERRNNLFRLHRAKFAARDRRQLGLVELMVAAQKYNHGARLAHGLDLLLVAVRVLDHVGHCLHLIHALDAEECSNLVDGLLIRRVYQLRQSIAGGCEVRDRRELRCRLLDVGRVARTGAGDEVFARVGGDHELLRAGSAHCSGVGLDHQELQPAAREDAPVDGLVLGVAGVQARLVDVERVGVLHQELAHTQQARLGARLVAKLGLDLVPDLRELFVAAQLVCGDLGHDLLVSHGEA